MALHATPLVLNQYREKLFSPRYNALRCNAALDAPRPPLEFIPWHFKQDDAERQGRDSSAERVEPDNP